VYNFNHLYYFYITAKSGRVAAAASHLRISQPSLSSQLKILETALDVKLFRKVGRTNELTEAGSLIFGFCRQMFELSEQMRELVTSQVPSVMRRIHIGVSDEVDRTFVVEVVSLFLKKHGLAQRPSVMVSSGNHAQLMNRLRFRELDGVVSELTATDPDLHNLSRAEVPVALTCSGKWDVRAAKGKIKAGGAIRQLMGREDVEWIMPSARFKLRSETDAFFEANELKGRVVVESDVMASLVRSVVDEIGVAFLPILYIARELREKSLRALGPKEGFWKYRIWLVCHHQNRDDLLIKALSRSFKEVCRHSYT
jgi:LysR family transcriptional regulator, transcriptional activator of nhaA